MNRNGFFMAMLGMMTVLMTIACPSLDKDDDKDQKDVWPNTSGYTYIGSSSIVLAEAKTKATAVSPGQKYYFEGILNSAYNNSKYYGITSAQNCAITIDFKKFNIGYLEIYLNDKNTFSYEADSDTVNITPGDMLVLEVKSRSFSMSSSRDYMVGFSVTAAE